MRRMLVSTLAVGVLTLGVLGAGSANAQTPTPTTQKPFYASLVDKIAASFNLDRAKVETVVTDWHKEKRTERMNMTQGRLEDRLSQLVKDDKITQAQKTAILNKLKEEKANFKPEDFKNMTPEERRQAMDKKRTDFENWAKSQGIDPNILMPIGMGRGGKMRMMH